MDTVFVVFITDSDGNIDSVHSVYKDRESAENEVATLQSRLVDSEAYYEEFEVN